MMFEAARSYVASPDFEQLGMLLAGSGGFDWIGGGNQGETVFREILALSPDVLLLDEALRGMDGLTLLERIGGSMAAPPRVLYLCRGQGSVWREMALSKGADRAIAFQTEKQDILAAARETAANPLPALAKPWEEARLQIASALIGELGVPPRLKGAAYMRWAAAMLACAPGLGASYSERLYPLTAERFETTASAVERAIRTAVESTWLRGNLDAIQRLFGFSVDADRGKPTNAEFLSMMAEHVRRETERRMRKNGA